MYIKNEISTPLNRHTFSIKLNTLDTTSTFIHAWFVNLLLV